MRVAQRMMSRNYKATLNNTLAKRAAAFDRSASGLQFEKLSDNVGDGARAMQIQEERYASERYLSNVKSLREEYKSVDSNMESIHSILQDAQEELLSGKSEEKGETGRQVKAQLIRSIRDQLLQFSNSTYAGKYLFGGTNNSSTPLTVQTEDKDGKPIDSKYAKLMFNGVLVEDIDKQAGTFIDTANGNEEVPNSGTIYADIGIGLKISAAGVVDPRTAFEASFSGLNMLGFGEAAQGKTYKVPSNAYDLLTDIANALENWDNKGFNGAAGANLNGRDVADDLYTQLVKLTDQVGMTRTELGTRDNFLERLENRLTEDVDNLGETETGLVSSKPTDEAINLKESEYVWLAVMQLGSMLLPTSLLDFIR